MSKNHHLYIIFFTYIDTDFNRSQLLRGGQLQLGVVLVFLSIIQYTMNMRNQKLKYAISDTSDKYYKNLWYCNKILKYIGFFTSLTNADVYDMN